MLIIQPRQERLQPVSSLLASLLVKYPDLQHRAQRAFITYLRSIHIQKDKDIFDVMKLPINEYSASLGLPMTPKIRFLNQKIKSKAVSTKSVLVEPEDSSEKNVLEVSRNIDTDPFKDEEIENDLFQLADSANEDKVKSSEIEEIMYVYVFSVVLIFRLHKIPFVMFLGGSHLCGASNLLFLSILLFLVQTSNSCIEEKEAKD